jgi:hypothetical protein
MSATAEDESGGGDTLNSGTLDALNKANAGAKAKRRDEVPSFSVDVRCAQRKKKKKKKKEKKKNKR